MATKIQVRRGTAASATTNNVVLAAGEIGLETDTGKFKIGDGTTAWTSLPYFSSGGGGYTTERRVQSAGSVLESMSRNNAINTAIPLTSGVERLILATIPPGQTLSTLDVQAGATAATSPTNQWMRVLRKSDGVFLSGTEDKLTEAWGAAGWKTFTLTTPQAGGSTGLDIAIGIMVAAGAPMMTLAGSNVPNGMSGRGVVLSWNVGSGLTTRITTNITMPVATGAGQAPFYVAGN